MYIIHSVLLPHPLQICVFETGPPQILMIYIHQLEQRLGIVPETKANGELPACVCE